MPLHSVHTRTIILQFLPAFCIFGSEFMPNCFFPFPVPPKIRARWCATRSKCPTSREIWRCYRENRISIRTVSTCTRSRRGQALHARLSIILVAPDKPTNLSGLTPGPAPLMLAGYPQLLAGGFRDSPARVSGGAPNHPRHGL